ncbi:MAG: ABC transporter ATP-binding protein [Chitinophagaceae bacterium]|nr:ABC transporter ATP-binding protein [Chitinophagaceae bacterium]
MNDDLIKIINLNVRFKTEYEEIDAVRNVSFQLKEGETLAIVGESGSGKSVTALSIMRLLSPNALIDPKSNILFVNKKNEQDDLVQIPQQKLASLRGNEIAMIFQEPMTSLNPLMRCGEQVAESLRLHLKMNQEMARRHTIELFTEVKLPYPEAAYLKYPHELSGGQKQRVMIAMAICCKPKLLIADEPTTALDVTVQKSILHLLKELQVKYKMAMLFITHDLNLVRSFADQVMVMYKSEAIETGPTGQIFENPQQNYTRSLLSCRPAQDIRVKYLSTVEEISSGLTIHPVEGNIRTALDFKKRIEEIEERKTILELHELHVWYPTKRNVWGKPTAWFKAVNGVNLQIREGETMGLVGESGCGKTTIGKSIVKLADIQQGNILYKGKSIADFSRSAMKDYRREVQIIFQDPYSSLNPRISIGSAIKEPMEVHGIETSKNRKARAISLLEKVGLQAIHYDRYPHEFSGGQRQRISIARALALNASFIICDESVSALDVSVQAQVLNLLVSLRDEFAFTYLFISHDLNVIKHISDHVSVMKNGRIAEHNNAEDLYHFPQHNYTKELLSSLQISKQDYTIPLPNSGK